jgi:ABC-type multidrug transport system ATPase subunit
VLHISLDSIGKRYLREWIVRGVFHEFSPGSKTVLLGANGSGKSTLLQLIAGNLMATEGALAYSIGDKKIPQEEIFKHLSIAAPYLEIMEEFTLAESVHFQEKFKPWRNGLTAKDIIQISGLAHAQHKQVRNFSSGMKQRVRLSLAILADTPLLLLDEPCANLDHNAMDWYGKLIGDHDSNRTIIVCSNKQQEEYFFCTEEINVENFKNKT